MLAQISYREGIEDAWSDVAQFVPKLVAALAIFVVGWIVAKIIRKVAIRVLAKIRFDEWVDRAGIGAHLDRAGYPDSGVLLAKIVYWGVLLLVLQLAIGVFGPNPVQDALDEIVAFLPKLFVAAIIVVITGAIAAKVREFVGGLLTGQSYGRMLSSFAFGAIWVIGVFAAIDQIQVAQDIVDLLFQALTLSLALIFAIMFGVGGIATARDRFWPRVYDLFEKD